MPGGSGVTSVSSGPLVSGSSKLITGGRIRRRRDWRERGWGTARIAGFGRTEKSPPPEPGINVPGIPPPPPKEFPEKMLPEGSGASARLNGATGFPADWPAPPAWRRLKRQLRCSGFFSPGFPAPGCCWRGGVRLSALTTGPIGSAAAA